MSTLKDLVLKAADLIEERGHAKEWYCNQDGALCIMGALSVAFQDSDHRVSQVVSAVRWGAGLGVHVGGGHHTMDIIRWNDAPSRVKDDVVTALRRGAGYL